MLIKQSRDKLDVRTDRGNSMLRQAWGTYPEHEEDRECAAKDAISDILTAVFGPAGHYRDVRGEDGRLERVTHESTYANASMLVSSALDSYFGDAEDYIEEPKTESPAVAAIKAQIEAKTIESHRIFLYAGGDTDAFEITDGQAIAAFQSLTDDETDKIYENFGSEDYEAMDEIRGVLGGLELALKVIEDAS